MAKYEIRIEAKGTDKAVGDFEKLGKASTKVSEQVEKTDGSFKKLAGGLTKFGRELPLLGTALDAIKNPLTALSAIAIFTLSTFRKYSAELKQMVSVMDNAKRPITSTGDAFQTASEGVAAMAAAMKDLQTYSNQVVAGLGNQLSKLEEQFAATQKLMEAEAELQKMKLERDEVDPIKRAKGKAAIDLALEQRKLGMAGLKNQQAAILDRQIASERELQVEAGANVPRRADLVAAVSSYESDKSRYNEAFTQNRQAFGRAELLRRFLRDGQGENFFKTFAPGDVRELQAMGLISGIREIGSSGVFANDPLDTAAGGVMRTNMDLARQLLPGAEQAQRSARDSLARARSALGASRGTLPAGVQSLADVDPFIDAANAAAAQVQNESYGREQNLIGRRDQLTQGAAVDIQLQNLRTQTVKVGGDIAVQQAQESALKQLLQSEREANVTSTKLLRDLIRENNRHKELLRQISQQAQ